MAEEKQKDPVSIKVSMRLPYKTYLAMQEAAADMGFTTVGRTVTWFALLGLQASRTASAAQRSADASVEMLALIKRASEAAEKDPEGSK